MKRQKAPPHPGEVLWEYLGDVSAAKAAETLVVGRSTLSRLLSGASGVSADMAICLGLALRTSVLEDLKSASCAGTLGRANSLLSNK
jgi:antitoxin HigA-1